MKKADGMINQVERFIQRSYQDYDMLKDSFVEMQESINEKINESKLDKVE